MNLKYENLHYIDLGASLHKFNDVIETRKQLWSWQHKVMGKLEPKQFKNNLIMFEDKPQFEFCRLLAGSNFEVDAQKNQNDV